MSSAQTLTKLEIRAYKDSQYNDQINGPDPIKVLFNPDQYTLNYKAVFSEGDNPPGKGAGPQKFERVAAQTFKLDVLFDGTGVANNPSEFLSSITNVTEPPDIHEEITTFRDTLIYYNGDNHETAFVKITWGKLEFKGRVQSVDINYTLFKPDGHPLRAKATLNVIEHMDEKDREDRFKTSSPDLTHVRTVSASDTLPLMCKRIYGDSKYYMEVARVNNLTNFRNLEPGTSIFFPPLDKSVTSTTN